MFLRTVICLSLLFGLLSHGIAFSAANDSADQRVAVFPFNMEHSGKYAPLGEVLHTMLSSRLSTKDGIEVVEIATTQKQYKLLQSGSSDTNTTQVFNKLGADYVVRTEVYEIQEELQLKATFFKKGGQEAPVIMNMRAEDESEIIENINLLADKAAEEVFEVGREDSIFSSNEIAAGFRTDHPEKAYRRGVYGGTLFGDEDGGVEVAKGRKATIKLDSNLVSIGYGDLDGDGEKEVVVASRTNVWILKIVEKRFEVLAEIPLGVSYKLNNLNLADFDGDGRDEMYISGSKRIHASSKVLSWNGGEEAVVINNNIPWYIRPMYQADGKLVLLGQRAGKEAQKGYVRKGVYILKKRNEDNGASFPVLNLAKNAYEADVKFGIPNGINIFDFVMADIDGDKMDELVSINSNEKLMVYEQDNSLVFVSDGQYGGSLNYFGHTPSSVLTTNNDAFNSVHDSEEEKRIKSYIPSRMLVVDVNGDGSEEIIVSRAKSEGYSFLTNTRIYSGGVVSCVSWDGRVMNELWKTNTISDYVADYFFSYTGNSSENGEGEVSHEAMLITGQYHSGGTLSLNFTEETKIMATFLEIQKGKMKLTTKEKEAN